MSKFNVGDKVRALANPTDKYYSNDGYFKVGEEFTVKEVFPVQGTVSLVERGQCWDESRFELVDEPVAPVVPQLPGTPEGFRAVRIGTPKTGEWYVGGDDEVQQGDGWQTAGGYVILERIDRPAPVELVTESPDDLVIQDRVPAREGIDFGWWVDAKDFDQFVPHISKVWKMHSSRSGFMHGYVMDADSKLAVMCYRKDLPELPTTEKVLFTEYVVWDDGGAKRVIWSTEDPSIEDDVLESWHHAHPTGNTRDIEVPVVKS